MKTYACKKEIANSKPVITYIITQGMKNKNKLALFADNNCQAKPVNIFKRVCFI
jgi:hypothetical protein